MLANPTLLQMKWARIVETFARRNKISTDVALNFFYHSDLYELMSHGVADIHCEGDGYLVQLLTEEWTNIES